MLPWRRCACGMRTCMREAVVLCAPAVRTACAPSPQQQQRRSVRYSTINETLRPIPGQSGGQITPGASIAAHPDESEEPRRPVFRLEVAPQATVRPFARDKATSSDAAAPATAATATTTAEAGEDETASCASTADTSAYLQTMYKWGYDSLTLFLCANESSGAWWQANSSVFAPTWVQLGDHGAADMWSGVRRYTYGVGEYNMRPYTVRGRTWGSTWQLPLQSASKTTAKSSNDSDSMPAGGRVLAVRYGVQAQRAQLPLQRFCVPHTAEHAKHDRVRNPSLRGYREMTAIHAKRVLRETQYHLGQGLRFYLVDGVLGSHPDTATAYRVFTDNPTHAYYLALAAIRKRGYVAYDEVSLRKCVSQTPYDEWAWRRPGVVVYDAAGYAFEAPRIVEEFGGPRPRDMGLSHHRALVVDPYSIPMKACLLGEPACEELLSTVALLCARWGYYADEQGLLTLPSESVLSRDGTRVTLVLTSSARDADVLRASPWLYGGHHHRLARGLLSRAWDVAAMPLSAAHEEHSNDKDSTTATQAGGGGAAPAPAIHAYDMIEAEEARVQRPLPLRLGLPRALSHRLLGRHRSAGGVGNGGYMRPHAYTNDVASRAYAAGLLFRRPAHDTLHSHPPRPSCMRLASVDVVVLTGNADAAESTTAAAAAAAPSHEHSGGDDGSTNNSSTTATAARATQAGKQEQATSESTVTRAVDAIMQQLRDKAFVYAEEAPLRSALAAALSGVRSIHVLPSSPALLQRIARGEEV